MEQTPRTPLRPHGLRPLGLPQPIHVELTPHGLPTRLRSLSPRRANLTRPRASGRTVDVLDVSEIWRIAEEWWRPHPIQRTYYRLVLQDGRPLTIFHDETAPSEGNATSEDATLCAGWFEQRY